jgi:NADP-dependent 3-hydroxy acid dehydrogenase YdfG
MAGTIVIYGGSGGIGSAVARTLHARGKHLHLVGHDENSLKTVTDELGAGLTVGDVNDDELFNQVVGDTPTPCDGLVYAVGTINLGSIRRLTPEDYLHDFIINSMGAALAIKAALPLMKKSSAEAAVVLFSSVAALQGFSLHASDCHG